MYTDFKCVDGFYMMIRFYDNNDIMILYDDLLIILYDDIWYDFDDATMWHIDIYYMMVLQDDMLYDDEMSWGHGDGYVVLRAPMDGPVIEVIYRETMIHFIETVWEILA